MRNLLEIMKINIFKNGLLRKIFIVTIIMVTTFPLYDFFVIRPSFEKFLTEGTTDEAKKITQHLVSMYLPQKTGLSKKTIKYYIAGVVEDIKSDFRLTKLKIFSNSGEIISSTDYKEIGNFNYQRYFHEIVANRKVLTNGIEIETKSLEGQLMPVDVVKTYVPLMTDGIFRGAFEIYYDITARKQNLDKLLFRSSAFALIIALSLLLSIVVILFFENKNISKRKVVEIQHEKMTAGPQKAITKIKKLRGVLPTCSNCKNIRDDKGYWKQIESYISDHSQAVFTHTICPKCAKKLYPELFRK